MFKSRFSRKAPLVVLVGVFAILSAQIAGAEEDRGVYLRFAGDFIQHLEQADADVNGVPVSSTNLLGLVRAKVKGNLGRADLTAVTKADYPMPGPDSDNCPAGFFKVVVITDNSLVFTFSDLSLLYGNGQGVVCANFGTGEQYIAVEGEWLGGTGRFRNAKGEFSIRFDDYVPVNPNTQIVAETGTITGTLSRDR